MVERSLADRVGILEEKVESLERLPEQMQALTTGVAGLRTEFLQFRAEVRGEFSAVRNEMRELHEAAMAQSRALFEDVIARIALLDEHRNGASRRKRR